MKNKDFEIFETLLNLIIKYFKWVVIAALILILLSGVILVDNDEAAVVLRFGKLVGQGEDRIKGPGLHFTFPYIIDEVIKVPVGKIQERTVTSHYGVQAKVDEGLRERWSSGAKAASDNHVKTGEYYGITGDHNIVLIQVRLKYKISDVIDYALLVNGAESILDGVVSGELNSLVAAMDVDSVLTSGKAGLADDLKKNGQKGLDALQCGMEITNVELTDLIPPNETKAAFDQVNAASVQKETMIQEANQYLASAIPQAQAQADEMMRAAMVQQSEAIIRATAETAEFKGLYKQYAKNPDSVMDGVFRKRVSDVLLQMGGTVIVPAQGESPKVLLP